MSSVGGLRAFADRAVSATAETLSTGGFEANSRSFDPDLPDEFTESDFERAVEQQAEEPGRLESHRYFGHVMGPQDRYPGSVRFVYGATFTRDEGLVILCVHERDGLVYLNEHVYYWD